MPFEYITEIAEVTPSRIVLLVVDGLGGLPHPKTGRSELEMAHIPNLDALAAVSVLGLTDPVLTGITPGSGPGHQALFGYDPVKHMIKRGVMEALGIGLTLQEGEIAARGNFCTLDSAGRMIDRRAGRIPTEESTPLCHLLDSIEVAGAELSVYPVKDHRFVAVFRGDGLNDDLSESDPPRAGLPPLVMRALSPGAEKLARIANEFCEKARGALAGRSVANMVFLRGFSQLPHVPSMTERLKLHPAAIAAYPMYRGLARIVGMEILDAGATLQDEFDALARHFQDYDFLFIHFKAADAAGEDGDFEAKVRALEEVDQYIPKLRALKPEVIMVAGDHSTPAVLAGHSWHPVPFLLHSAYCRPDGIGEFSEKACARGTLGRFPAQQALLLAMANALKLTKFGA